MSAITLPLIAPDRRRRAFRAILFVISGVLALFALAISARAAPSHVLVIPQDDGYGFEECLMTKSACGAVVADAWCEANGLKASKAFGRAEDFQANAGEDRPDNIAPGAFYVACGDKI